MRRAAGLRELAGDYDSLLCDIWGVVHNGVSAFPQAVEALRRFRAEVGPVVLLTNAPRPSHAIRAQLESLGVDNDTYDAVLSSGDVTRGLIAARPGVKLYNIGPERDRSLYRGLDIAFAPEDEAELVCCTGLVDDTTETPEHYRPLLSRLAARGLTLICANPDLVVDRGGTLVYCAGALARLYVEIGGEAVLVGKPHAPVYDTARRLIAELGGTKCLAVGDGLPTDIAGAWGNGFPVLFVTGGIHAADFGPHEAPDPERVKMRLKAEGLGAIAYMPALVWDGGA
jgi:HAD superfamily hydrolase (TIGR01459 family)